MKPGVGLWTLRRLREKNQGFQLCVQPQELQVLGFRMCGEAIYGLGRGTIWSYDPQMRGSGSQEVWDG